MGRHSTAAACLATFLTLTACAAPTAPDTSAGGSGQSSQSSIRSAPVAPGRTAVPTPDVLADAVANGVHRPRTAAQAARQVRAAEDAVGDVVLRPGYESPRSVPVERYLRNNPRAAST